MSARQSNVGLGVFILFGRIDLRQKNCAATTRTFLCIGVAWLMPSDTPQHNAHRLFGYPRTFPAHAGHCAGSSLMSSSIGNHKL